jgi:hypothetical protein
VNLLTNVRRVLRPLVPAGVRQVLSAAVARAHGGPVSFHKGWEPHPAHIMLVATHHKTGTVWMRKVFKRVAALHALRFFAGKQTDLPSDTDIFLQHASRFDLDALPRPAYRGVHLIRDPRDIIVSACFYHQKSEEAWLHKPEDAFGGRTYQEEINSYESFDEKLSFEMQNASRHVINAIGSWNYDDPSFLEVRYEDLIADADLRLFHEIFTFLGFPGRILPSTLAIAHDQSLFSGNTGTRRHIRSGVAKQWPQYFRPQHIEQFNETFGDLLVQLGYEISDDWMQAVPDR